MIDLAKLRKEEDTLRALQRDLRLVAGSHPNAEQARTLREIQERLCAIADELRGPCIVV